MRPLLKPVRFLAAAVVLVALGAPASAHDVEPVEGGATVEERAHGDEETDQLVGGGADRRSRLRARPWADGWFAEGLAYGIVGEDVAGGLDWAVWRETGDRFLGIGIETYAGDEDGTDFFAGLEGGLTRGPLTYSYRFGVGRTTDVDDAAPVLRAAISWDDRRSTALTWYLFYEFGGVAGGIGLEWKGRYRIGDRWDWGVHLDISSSEKGGADLEGYGALLYRLSDPGQDFTWRVGPAITADLQRGTRLRGGGLLTAEF